MNVVLHQPEIPQNTGNIGRTCVATGAKLWLIRPLGFRVDDQRMRRAGLDYWQHLDIEIVDSWTAFMERHAAARLWFFTKTAERVYTDVEFQRDDFLVFGGETRGNKEEHDESFPAFVLHLTDFSPNRKDPLKREIRVSNSRDQINELWDELASKYFVGGWNPAEKVE